MDTSKMANMLNVYFVNIAQILPSSLVSFDSSKIEESVSSTVAG